MNNPGNGEKHFSDTIGEKEQLKLKAKRHKPAVWNGIGLSGMVGWSVAAPTLLGIAAGWWLDKKYPQHFSWALTGLFAGLISGCGIAWRWIVKENKSIHKNTEEDHE